jgi:hypothetical protein
MSAVAERGVVAQLKEEVVEDDRVLAHHGREEEAVAYQVCCKCGGVGGERGHAV